MTEIVFGIFALLVLIFSFFKTKSLQKSLENLDLHIQTLKEQATEIPFKLKGKVNLLMTLKRKNNSQPTPIVCFEKLGKSVPSFFSSDTIYSLAEEEGFGLTGTCEGNGDCGLCAIEVLGGKENITPKSNIEKEILEKLNYKGSIRLCCQTNITGNVTVNFVTAKDQ